MIDMTRSKKHTELINHKANLPGPRKNLHDYWSIYVLLHQCLMSLKWGLMMLISETNLILVPIIKYLY